MKVFFAISSAFFLLIGLTMLEIDPYAASFLGVSIISFLASIDFIIQSNKMNHLISDSPFYHPPKKSSFWDYFVTIGAIVTMAGFVIYIGLSVLVN